MSVYIFPERDIIKKAFVKVFGMEGIKALMLEKKLLSLYSYTDGRIFAINYHLNPNSKLTLNEINALT
jgi:hypothetical protein